ncbi:MAG: hypothetical protein HKN47_06680 [Pirellulaceae bacterium]|nr:hypothetical protein [Pirellulaceae bacterium]
MFALFAIAFQWIGHHVRDYRVERAVIAQLDADTYFTKTRPVQYTRSANWPGPWSVNLISYG